MTTTVSLLAWNIQILGDTKIQRLLAANTIAMIFARLNPDIIAIQELVYKAGEEVLAGLSDAMTNLNNMQGTWAGTYVQANPDSQAERDGYLFLWRSDRYSQQQIGGQPVQGVFTGDFPNNIAPRGGRRVGYIGLTLPDGSHPFIVGNYHAPTYKSVTVGSAPATGLAAIATQAAQLTTYNDGGAKAYDARFLCGDFNIDINAGANKATWYQPAMTATATTNGTTANTHFISSVPSPRPTNPAAYVDECLDNILAGPAANLVGCNVYNLIDVIQDKALSRAIEGMLFAANMKVSLGNASVYDRYSVARQIISDHLPILMQFNVVP